MTALPLRKLLLLGAAVLAICFAGPYLLSLFFPFLLGYGLARVSEPPVRMLTGKLPRYLASFIGVMLTLILGCGLISILGGLLIRELGKVAHAAPDIRETFLQGVQLLQDFLIGLSNRAPEGIRPLMIQGVLQFFSSGTELLDKAVSQIPALLGALLGKLPDRFLSLGTGILAGFLISARLPGLKSAVSAVLPPKWKTAYLPMWQKARGALLSWLKAQGKLALVTFLVVTGGLLMLRIPYAPAWGALIALVDGVPMLGTGTILLPWALIKLLQSQTGAALGLLGIYGAAMGLRVILEPRFLGRHLGLDPLVTLICLYLGYRFWGLWGMIFFPMMAGAVKSVFS